MKGDVRLRVESWMPEKLLQRALEQGICLKQVERPDDHTLIVETGERDARRLLGLCRRFSIPARVLSRRGGSALGRWLRRRWTLLPGLALAAALCAFALSRVWRIDIRFTGDAAARGSEAYIASLIGDMGLRPGMGRDIDAAALSEELQARAKGYSFIAARLEGGRLLVEAAPEVPAPEVYRVEDARDLYASRAGIVVSVNVEAGEACVQPGDTVKRGQLLIRGEERSGREATRPIAALGEVVIRTWFEGRAEGSLRAAQLRYTGRESTAQWLSTPWLDIPIVPGEEYAHQAVETASIPVGGLYVPVCVVRQTRRELRSVVERGDRELLSTRLTALSMADARAALWAEGPREYGVVRSWIRYTQADGDALKASAVLEITMNAAETRKDDPKGG